MDRMALRNLLLNPKLRVALLSPMGYPRETLERVCAVVEEALKLKPTKGNRKLLAAVKRLRRLK